MQEEFKEFKKKIKIYIDEKRKREERQKRGPKWSFQKVYLFFSIIHIFLRLLPSLAKPGKIKNLYLLQTLYLGKEMTNTTTIEGPPFCLPMALKLLSPPLHNIQFLIFKH